MFKDLEMPQANRSHDLIKSDFQLPSLPEVAMKILEAVKQDEFSFSGLGNIISADPALTAKILKMANSSFYSLPQKVSTIDRAISILGVTALKNIALSFVISKEFRKNGNTRFDFGYFWKRSVTAAISANLIAKLASDKNDDLFVTALLMDIGSIIMLLNRPEDYMDVLDDKRVTGLPTEVIEKNIFGIDHQHVGAEVLKKWGLDKSIYQPVSQHHEKSISTEDFKKHIKILSIADKISGAYHGSKRAHKVNLIKTELKNEYNLTDREIEKLIDTVAENSLEIFTYFEIEPGDMKPYSQILQEANEELGKLVYSYEQLLMNFKEEKERAESLARELREKNDRLRNLSVRDGLTGMFNHKYLQEYLDKEIARCKRYKRSFSLILFDLDHFKKINDNYGHRIGDMVLQKIGDVVLSLIRENDIAARYGGEEFAVILPETGLQGSIVIAEKIRRAVENLEIIADSNLLKVTISVGAASYLPEKERTTKAELIDAADSAMYHAKQSGRNKLSVASGA